MLYASSKLALHVVVNYGSHLVSGQPVGEVSRNYDPGPVPTGGRALLPVYGMGFRLAALIGSGVLAERCPSLR